MVTRTHKNIIYGDTEAAIMAGISSARQGVDTALIVPPSPGFTVSHPGGTMANALISTDLGSSATQILGTGVVWRFFHLNTQWYGPQPTQFRIEPHVSEELFAYMIRESIHLGLTLYVDEVVNTVTTAGTTITGITTLSGNTYIATSYYADGTYEGDILAYSGLITWTLGREANDDFLAAPPAGTSWIQAVEVLAGADVSTLYGYNNNIIINPYQNDGITLLPGVFPLQATAPGGADSEVQATGFRVCLTKDPSNRINFSDPGGDPLDYELQRRNLVATSTLSISKSENGKFDWNYDFVNYTQNPTYYQKNWPTQTWTQRAATSHAWYVQQASYIFFLDNNDTVPATIAKQVGDYALTGDDFTDNTFHTRGWPRLPYPREGRRPRGQYVLTLNDIQNPAHITKPHSIGLGNYPFDCHTVGFFLNPDNVSYHLDSNAAVPASMLRVKAPYELPLEMFLPMTSECTNLVFLCAASMSHCGYNTVRIVVTWMKIGAAMGTIMGLAAKLGVSISALDYTTQIAPALIAEGIVLHYP